MCVRGVVGNDVKYACGVYGHLHAHVHVSDVVPSWCGAVGCSGWGEWGCLRNSRVGSRRCR